MQDRSDLWQEYAADGTVPLQTVVVIDGVEYTAVSAPVISSGISSDTFSLGNCTSATMEVSILTDDTIAQSAEVVVKMRYVNGDSATEWLERGTFYVSKRTEDHSTGLVTLQCYDAMLKTRAAFPEEILDGTWPRYMGTVIDEIADYIGVEADSRNLFYMSTSSPERYYISYPGNYTMEEVLGYIAACFIGNFIISPQNKLRLVCPKYPGGTVDVVGITGALTKGESTTVTGVSMTGTDGTTYTYGTEDGHVIKIEDNPYAAKGTCSLIYSWLKGIVWQPYEMTGAIYDPAAELGDTITYMDGLKGILWQETATLNIAPRMSTTAPDAGEIEDEYPYKSTAEKLAEESVSSQTVYYATSDSTTAAPDSSATWSTTCPDKETGVYIWMKTVTTYVSGSTSESDPVCISGLDGADGADGQMLYAACSSEETTAAKVAVLASGTMPALTSGVTVAVTFTYANSAESPTLNVAESGDVPIYVYGNALTAASIYNWVAGATIQFVYDGEHWVMSDTSALYMVGQWCYSNNKMYIDGASLYAGTVAAEKLYVTELSAITANVGTLTAGVIQSTNYSDTAGLQINLNSGAITSPYFTLDNSGGSFTGTVTTESGDYKTVLSSGTIKFYYEGSLAVVMTHVASTAASQMGILGQPDNDGVAIGETTNSGTINTYYRMNTNDGYEDEGYRHVFVGMVCMKDEVTLSDYLTFENGYGIKLNDKSVFRYDSSQVHLGTSDESLQIFASTVRFRGTNVTLENGHTLYFLDTNGDGRTGISLTSSNNYNIATGGIANNIYIGTTSYTSTMYLRGTYIEFDAEAYATKKLVFNGGSGSTEEIYFYTSNSYLHTTGSSSSGYGLTVANGYGSLVTFGYGGGTETYFYYHLRFANEYGIELNGKIAFRYYDSAVALGVESAPLKFYASNVQFLSANAYIDNGYTLYLRDTNGDGRTGITLTTSNNYNIATGGIANNIYIGQTSYTSTLALRAGTAITASVAITTSSDARLKQNITALSEDSRYSVMFDNLVPSTFEYIYAEGKRHPGFTTQGVLEAMEAAGLSRDEFAGVIDTEGDDGETYGALSYTDMTALLVYEVQELKKQMAALMAG